MRLYLVQPKAGARHASPLQPPRLITAPDARTACEFAGLTVETAHVKDVTRRTLQPHHISPEPCDHPCQDFLDGLPCPCGTPPSRENFAR